MNPTSPTSPTTPFMTQAGYEQALEEFQLDCEYWKRLEEKMKRQQEERVAEWKRKDELAKTLTLTLTLNPHQDEIKKYSQEEIDEAIRQLRIERLKKLLNPYNV